jgi:hypothetical protein
MKLSLITLAMVSLAAAFVGAFAAEPPKPALVPASWQLEFEYKDLMPITVKLPGEETPKVFWYLIYTVTNRTGEDRIFVPSFQMYTDTGELIPAGASVPPNVFEEIKKVYNDPLMRQTTALTGKLLQGEDNAKTGVAIFPDFDPQVGVVDVFVGGLSGEAATVKLPSPITVTEVDAEGKKVQVQKDTLVLSKQLDLRYRVGAAGKERAHSGAAAIAKEWVMR